MFKKYVLSFALLCFVGNVFSVNSEDQIDKNIQPNATDLNGLNMLIIVSGILYKSADISLAMMLEPMSSDNNCFPVVLEKSRSKADCENFKKSVIESLQNSGYEIFEIEKIIDTSFAMGDVMLKKMGKEKVIEFFVLKPEDQKQLDIKEWVEIKNACSEMVRYVQDEKQKRSITEITESFITQYKNIKDSMSIH